MAIPKYNEFFPYVIEFLSDGKEHTLKEISRSCAEKAKLSDEEMGELLPSGAHRYADRVSWACTYLKKAGLIERVSRAIYQITDAGIKAYSDGSKNVNLEYLHQFDCFNEFLNAKYSSKNNTSNKNKKIEVSPQEQLELSINEINSTLQDELMSELLKISPYDFESLVVKLLIKMGYGTLRQNETGTTKKSGDEGIDGIVSSDKFGFDSIYIQAKKWQASSTVGRPEIQKFLGALAGQGASKGIFITTAHFSKEALEFAEKQLTHKIILVDGKRLSELMVEYDLGVSVVETYVVKRVDYDFFNEEF